MEVLPNSKASVFFVINRNHSCVFKCALSCPQIVSALQNYESHTLTPFYKIIIFFLKQCPLVKSYKVSFVSFIVKTTSTAQLSASAIWLSSFSEKLSLFILLLRFCALVPNFVASSAFVIFFLFNKTVIFSADVILFTSIIIIHYLVYLFKIVFIKYTKKFILCVDKIHLIVYTYIIQLINKQLNGGKQNVK